MSDLESAHRARLEQLRSSMNLVGPGPLDVHFEDCRLAIPWAQYLTGRWADLGSGAGFPGLVFAHLVPELELDLVDSREKRCAFLQMVVAEGARGRPAPIRVLRSRVEDLTPGYDGAMARAFAPPEVALAHMRRVVRPGGLGFLMVQEHQPLPEAIEDHLVVDAHYTVEDKERRSVLFRLVHDA